MHTKKTIVVGVDCGASSDEVLVDALQALQTGMVSMLHVVHVIDPGEVDEEESSRLVSAARLVALVPDALRARLDYLAKMLGVSCGAVPIVIHARFGHVAETLLEVCADVHADLMVIGTRGSIAADTEDLVRRASCPVLLARPRGCHRSALGERSNPLFPSCRAPAHSALQDLHGPAIGVGATNFGSVPTVPTGRVI